MRIHVLSGHRTTGMLHGGRQQGRGRDGTGRKYLLLSRHFARHDATRNVQGQHPESYDGTIIGFQHHVQADFGMAKAPARKSALRGSQSAALATRCARGGWQSAVPATKCALRGSQSAAPATVSARGASQSSSTSANTNQRPVPATRFREVAAR